MEEKIETIIEQVVDYLFPELTPYESNLYLYLVRSSFLKNNHPEVRVGKRTIATEYGRGSRGQHTNYAHISKLLQGLEEKGCIKVGDTNRLGTLYIVRLPKEIPLVAEKIAQLSSSENKNEDYFNDPTNRLKLFERDKWTCQYCGEKVTQDNATLDHFIPQAKSGTNDKDNLRICCWRCNSIKSGKTYEEAAPLLLKSIREQKARL